MVGSDPWAVRRAQPDRGLLFVALLVVELPWLLNGFYNPALARLPLLYWTVDLVTYFILPIAVLCYLYRQGMLRGVRIWNPAGVRQIVLDVALGMVVFALIIVFPTAAKIVVFWFAGPLYSPPQGFLMQQLGRPAGVMRWLLPIYFSLGPGILEEVMVRGIFRLLFEHTRAGMLCYVFFSVLLFSLGHWESGPYHLIGTFVWGGIAAAFYIWHGRLLSLIIAHTAYNRLVCLQSW